MFRMVKIRVQRHEGLTVVGFLGLREGKAFPKVHLEFANGRYITYRFLAHAASQKGVRQYQMARDSQQGEFLVVGSSERDGRLSLDALFEANEDSPELTVRLDPDTVEEVLELMAHAKAILHTYDKDLVRHRADEKIVEANAGANSAEADAA